MGTARKTSFMEKLAAFIVDGRGVSFLLFAVAAIFCAVSRGWVQVNDDLTAYLPESTETRQGLELMNREFTTFGAAQIMVENVTYDQAEALCSRIEEKPDLIVLAGFIVCAVLFIIRNRKEEKAK